MLKRFLKNEKGLTLIELLAVIVILGIVAAIAVPTIGNVIQKSKENAIKADAMQVLDAARTYVAENGVQDKVESLSKTELSSYVDTNKLGDYTVSIDPEGKTFKLNAGPIKVGSKVEITFKNATKDDINKDSNYGKTRTIPE